MSETEVRLTREITSVMMTTSGFISPAREGKLPDSKAPIIPTFDYPKPIVQEPIIIPPAVPAAGADNLEKVPKKKKPAEKKEKVANKDLFKGKVAPMGPPPPKQMPPQAGIIFPPSDSPMAAIVEQQQQQNQKRKSTSKSERKHKQKDPNKMPNKSGEGKSSKKKKKLQQQQQVEPQMPIEVVDKPWDSMSGIAPLVPISPAYVNDNNVKLERPITPDIHNDLFLPDPQTHPPMPVFNLPPGTTSTLTTSLDPSPILPLTPTAPIVNQFEGKIASEPDKRKMNIFKRISTKTNKDDVKPMLPNLPETTIFAIDDSPYPQQPPPFIPIHANNTIIRVDEQPLNMSMPKQLQLPPDQSLPFDMNSAMNSMQFLLAGGAAAGKPKKEPKPKKVREKKPPKVREKKTKAAPVSDWPKNMINDGMAMAQPPPQVMQMMSPPPPKPMVPKKIGHLPPTLGNIDDEAMYNQFGPLMGNVPWFPGAQPGLIPMAPMPTGPGLIPSADFFNNFPMHPPFGNPAAMNHIPSFGMPNANMRPEFPVLKRPRIDDEPFVVPSGMPIDVDKVKCNVAPLVPESLQLDNDDVTFVPTTSKQQKNRAIPNNTVTKRQPSPVKQHPKEPVKLPVAAPLPFEIPPGYDTAPRKRRRSTMSPPKTPVIIDLDVQSISDDELPDDMDLDDVSPDNSADVTPATDDAVPPADKKDKSAAKLEKKRDKEHRKKDKEGKIKKKKDKKNKSKGIEKSEKRKGKEEKKRDKEAKEKLKKEKREKKREKERLAAMAGTEGAVDGAARLGFGDSLGPDAGHINDAEASVPKLTLKLGQSPRPNTPDVHRKM